LQYLSTQQIDRNYISYKNCFLNDLVRSCVKGCYLKHGGKDRRKIRHILGTNHCSFFFRNM
jgi:hypothetical protein